MADSVTEWEHVFYPDQISIRCIQVRPGSHKHVMLIKKCLHVFLNGRPAAATKRFHACFYDLYRDFKIPPQTIPLVIIEVTAKPDAFDIKL